jgi:hypothetical protein
LFLALIAAVLLVRSAGPLQLERSTDAMGATFSVVLYGTDLASIRTDREGRYELRLPAPAERVHVSIPQSIRAPDGTFQQARLAGPAADPFNQERVLTFNVLTGDVENADWVVNSAEAKKP